MKDQNCGYCMRPGQKYLTDEEYAEMIEKIKANL